MSAGQIVYGIRSLDGPSIAAEDSRILLSFDEPGPLSAPVAAAAQQRWRQLCVSIAVDDGPPAMPAPAGMALDGMAMVAETMERLLARLYGRAPIPVRPFAFAPHAFLMSPAAQPVAAAAARLALSTVSRARPETLPPGAGEYLAGEAEKLRQSAARLDPAIGMDPITALMVAAARAASVPCRHSLIQPGILVLGEGRRQIRFDRAGSLAAPVLGAVVTVDKLLTKRFLAGLGLPVLPCQVVRAAAGMVPAAAAIGYPLAVKPIDGSLSQGVTLDVRTAEQALAAYAHAEAEGTAVMVEPYLDTPDFRATVIGGRARMVMRRNRPFVIGDGTRSIAALIDAHNGDIGSARAQFPGGYPIAIDDEVRRTLEGAGRTPESIPAVSEQVFVRTTPVRSQGGYPVDVTAAAHPDTLALMEHLAQALGAPILAVDFRAEAIERSWRDQRFAILEANGRPSITDIDGDRLARDLVAASFPDPAAVRLPTIVVVRAEAADDARHLAALLAGHPSIGLASPAGVFLGPFRTMAEPPSLAAAHDRFAEAPTIAVAVHWTTPERIEARGLGVDRIDHAFLPEPTSDGPATDGTAAAVHDLVRHHAACVDLLPAGDAAGWTAPVLAAIERQLRGCG